MFDRLQRRNNTHSVYSTVLFGIVVAISQKKNCVFFPKYTKRGNIATFFFAFFYASLPYTAPVSVTFSTSKRIRCRVRVIRSPGMSGRIAASSSVY